jgi:predicted phage terminase large subunit-like protein
MPSGALFYHLGMLKAEDAAFSRLIAYAAYQWPGYIPAAHHRLIARKLEAVERGEIKRLMIFMPPRHGKSMLASEFFPAWYMGRNPDHYVVAATYGQDLADDFGRKVKNQIEDPIYQQIFPGVSLSSDSRSVRRFHVNGAEGGFEHSTKQNGAYYAVGVGGPLTGRGAHLLLIDDPVKDRVDADSEISRKNIKAWYTSTAYTRLMTGGAIIVIQTRWHEDDLAGWLLKEHAFEGWDVLSLPALQADGTALWPEKFPVERLERIRQASSTVGNGRDWSALYQQSPSPDEGTFFQRDWFKTWNRQSLPPLNYYGTSDYAVTDGRGDYTVHRVWGIAPNGDVYRVDGWRGQTASNVWIDKMLDLVDRYQPLAWFGESGVIRNAIEPMLTSRMREREIHCRMEWLSSIHDKPTRARGFQARAAAGRVYFEPGADLDEFLRFPAGANDDDVDTASMIGRAIDMAHPAIVAQNAKPKPVDRWAQAFEREDDTADSWKIT